METGVRKLRVWHESMALVTEVYRLSRAFPRDELFGLTSQVRRAAVSIPSNLAEGYSRRHTREYLHFVCIALGSSAELETQLELAARLNFLSSTHADDVLGRIRSVRYQLGALRSTLGAKLRSSAKQYSAA